VVPIVPVAFNVSALQLQNHALANHIVECLSKHGLDSHCLQIEVTESCLVENLDTAGAILDHLVEAGMHISLDDFGTGFSSLGYIKNLPIDTIKIDRSFISNIRNSHDDTVIVTSTITLAHNLGMRVVAEGVETSEQLVYLRASGCDEIQGYYFSRPLPDVEIRKLLIQERLTP
jgi:EAL domain-containing protein (putative c-di-GMP-specific phosphodiesterase class I)